MPPLPFDPSGIGLQRQGMDTYLAFKDAQRQQDYGGGGNVIDQAVHMTGPLPDPKWQAFFQALQNQGVSKITPNAHGYQGTPSPQPSNQLQGTSAQPDFFTGGDTFRGRSVVASPDYVDRGGLAPDALGRSVAVLKNRARPMPEGHDTFLRRLYGNDPQSLAAAGLTPGGS